MPTDKPYKVSVRTKQHDKPTRRVPPKDTVVGDHAVTVVFDGDWCLPETATIISTENDGVDLLASPNGLGVWLALGTELMTRSASPQTRNLLSTTLEFAYELAKNPDHFAAAQQLADEITAVLEQRVVDLAKQTSTAGKN